MHNHNVEDQLFVWKKKKNSIRKSNNKYEQQKQHDCKEQECPEPSEERQELLRKGNQRFPNNYGDGSASLKEQMGHGGGAPPQALWRQAQERGLNQKEIQKVGEGRSPNGGSSLPWPCQTSKKAK